MLNYRYQDALLFRYRFFNMFTTIISNPARAALLTTYKPDSYSLSMPLAQSVIINALMTCLGVDEKKTRPLTEPRQILNHITMRSVLLPHNLLSIYNHDSLIVIAHLLSGQIEHSAVLLHACGRNAIDTQFARLAVNLNLFFCVSKA